MVLGRLGILNFGTRGWPPLNEQAESHHGVRGRAIDIDLYEVFCVSLFPKEARASMALLELHGFQLDPYTAANSRGSGSKQKWARAALKAGPFLVGKLFDPRLWDINAS